MRIAVISDVHSNMEALSAVLRHAGSRAPIDGIWCAGDIVGYGAEPGAVIAALRARGVVTVAGNHDLAACGRMDTAEFNPLAATAVEWTAKQLSGAEAAYLRGLPLVATPAPQVTIVHGTLQHPEWEYLLEPAQARDHFALQETPYSIVGHTHLQLLIEEGDAGAPPAVRAMADGERHELGERRLILNPGGVGQPRDGDPRAGYMLYDDGAAAVSWHRVEYDAAAAAAKIELAGLPPFLARRLLIGR